MNHDGHDDHDGLFGGLTPSRWLAVVFFVFFVVQSFFRSFIASRFAFSKREV